MRILSQYFRIAILCLVLEPVKVPIIYYCGRSPRFREIWIQAIIWDMSGLILEPKA